jgi:protein tyrosine phosphatase (PTP) superfamily phosphohydrolase (DUF442 family)
MSAISFKMKKYLKIGLLFLISLSIFILFYIYIYGNFHQVDKNFYRSGQLYSYNYPFYLKKYKIKSVLSLRGYPKEIAILKEKHIKYYNFPISARKELTQEEMNRLIGVMRQAPKPLLIHCQGGADRSSLATALYLYAIKHDIKKAQSSFSVFYGHIPWIFPKTSAMDKSFKKYIKLHPIKIQKKSK